MIPAQLRARVYLAMTSGSPQTGVPEAAAWRVAYRAVLLTFALLIGLWLLVQLRAVVVQVVLAVILAAGMTPLVDRIAPVARLASRTGGQRRWTLPRALVVLLLYLLLVLLIVGMVALLVPPVVSEVEELVRQAPEYAANFQAWITELPSRYSFLPALDVNQGLTQQLRSGAAQFAGVLSRALVVVQVLVGLLSGALNGIFILFLALYLTVDSNRIQKYMIGFLPADRREQALDVTARIGDRLGGWVRGQIMLSAIIGGITLIGLWVLDVRYAVLLSLVAALGEAVPLIGPIISSVPAIIIAFFHSPVQGLLTIGLYVLVQQLENTLVVPKVMERAVSLHPLAVMVALLAGAELLGVTGAILSVPVAAAFSVVIDEVREERERHRLRKERDRSIIPAAVSARQDRVGLAPSEALPSTVGPTEPA